MAKKRHYSDESKRGVKRDVMGKHDTAGYAVGNDASKFANLPEGFFMKDAGDYVGMAGKEIGNELRQIDHQLDGDEGKSEKYFKLRKA